MGFPTRYLELVGSCLVVGADGSSASPTGFRTGLINATARSGAGVYTVAIDQGADNLEATVSAQIMGGAGNANIQVAWTSDILLTVTTFVAAVATDENFKLSIFRVKNAGS